MYVVFLLLSLTPPHKCVCDVWECVSEWERCGVAPFGKVLVLSPPLLCLPSCLLSCRKLNALKEMLLSLLISPFHSLTLPLPFSSLARSLTLSLSTLTGCVPLPLASSSLLSSSSYIISYVCVSCCSLVTLRAVCNQWKGFPASVHKVEFTDGNSIHPTLQGPPPSTAIHFLPPSKSVYPTSLF